MKCFVCILLVFCLTFSSAFAEEEKKDSIWKSIGDWIDQATKETSNWASDAWKHAFDWAESAWNNSSAWASQTWEDALSWTNQAWQDTSGWTAQAWIDSAKWVSQTWSESSDWTATNWDHFIVWINTITAGSPYSWIKDATLNDGIIAYDRFVELRSFLNSNPDETQIRLMYDKMLSELSILNEDKGILWNMIQSQDSINGCSVEQIAMLTMPYIIKLQVEGESVIGDDAIFSGPVVGQYLLTSLEAMHIDSSDVADMRLKIMKATLDGLVYPTIIGDSEQNTLVTDDRYFIENFSYENGKYQIIMAASEKDNTSHYPLLRGKTLAQTVESYFEDAVCGETTGSVISNLSSQSTPFSCAIANNRIVGKAVSVWAQQHYYLFFVITDKDWDDAAIDEWTRSISLNASNSIHFSVDMESDGAFYGINQSAQKYTVNRIFDEDRFRVPKTGHGWTAERGNNLIDNLKGFFKGEHSKIVGDTDIKNGADRVKIYADGTIYQIQSKYCSTASRSISACFDEHGFRYMYTDTQDSLSVLKPMSIEVPADQYDAAVEYMKNRIRNNEVPGVTDPEIAVDIVKKGNLTYQQAKHIAKAGTVESILYDSAHSCVTAASSFGISTAVSFALNLWNGESVEASIKESIFQGLKTGGISFIISVLSSQVAKTSINSAMVPASKVIVHALGPKVSAVIVNAFRPAANAIYGAAAMQSAAKLLRGNAITSTVTFVVLSAGDVADIIQGKISWKQLAKNASVSAIGITGGALGYIGGAALGTAILPGAGTVVGIIVSVAAGLGANEGAKALADLIAEDDADEMIQIIETQFPEIVTEYFLNEEEVNQSVTNLQALLTPQMLKQMYQHKDHEDFARKLIEMAMDPVVAQRAYVELPSEEEYSTYLTDVLEAIYEEETGKIVTE